MGLSGDNEDSDSERDQLLLLLAGNEEAVSVDLRAYSSSQDNAELARASCIVPPKSLGEDTEVSGRESSQREIRNILFLDLNEVEDPKVAGPAAVEDRCESQQGDNGVSAIQLLNSGEDGEWETRKYCNQCPSKGLRLAVVLLVTALFFIDTSATTVVVPLVPTYLNRSNIEVGVMFGTKALAQILTNPAWGRLTDGHGSMLALFSATILYVIAMLMHAFAASTGAAYAMTVAGRGVLGVASAAVGTGGPALLATIYLDDGERGWAMGIALAGYALGAMAGAPVGGASSLGADVVSAWRTLFLALAAAGVVACLWVVVVWLRLPPVFRRGMPGGRAEHSAGKPTSLWTLLKDKQILLVASVACVANMGVSALDPLLPAWADEHFSPQPSDWQEGLVYLPLYLAYFLTTPFLGRIVHRCSKWLLSAASLFGGAVFILVIPFVPSDKFWLLLLPMTALGVCMGVVDIVTYPLMATIMDARHSATYGNVYALNDTAFSINYLLAPLLATGLADGLGLRWAFFGLAIFLFLWVPVAFLLRRIEHSQQAPSATPHTSRSPSPVSMQTLT